jgi:phosphatidylinositol 4-kinase type 2
LELTRRARVCVWDDIVDIPVAMPMHAPSSEMRHRQEADLNNSVHEEMDISAANGSAAQLDLLDFASPPADLPNPNRFELSNVSPRPSEESSRLMSPQSPSEIMNGSFPEGWDSKSAQLTFAEPPKHGPRSSMRLSYSGPNRSSPQGSRRETRRFSFSTRRGSNPHVYDGDDLEGDLGYAAAEGMEGNRRKAIVERLETVKSKNPVFTWC